VVSPAIEETGAVGREIESGEKGGSSFKWKKIQIGVKKLELTRYLAFCESMPTLVAKQQMLILVKSKSAGNSPKSFPNSETLAE
jgi:hypothetical protein